MKKQDLRKYAQLIAVMGGHIKKGQSVVIEADLEQPEFVGMLVRECYKAGAAEVTVEWECQALTKEKYKYESAKTLSDVKDWQIEKMKEQVRTLPVRIYLLSEDPDGLEGIDPEKYAAVRRARGSIFKPYRDAAENKYQWCIAAVPGEKWAKKVFPGVRTEKAVELLWEAILSASRAIGDPIANWKAHNENLANRCNRLNTLGIKSLHYTASNGTDLTVGLLRDSLFSGGEDITLYGDRYDANIPSEECFTTPDKTSTEGIVYSSMPLCYDGQMIDRFYLRFEKGRVTEAHAETGDNTLQKIISMDEGSAMLGECALIPCDSPIAERGLLFYNTLFDENASCHFALGMGFINCIRNYENFAFDELVAKGVNNSLIHVDFMIGTKDLSVTATTYDNKIVPIFKNGTWYDKSCDK